MTPETIVKIEAYGRAMFVAGRMDYRAKDNPTDDVEIEAEAQAEADEAKKAAAAILKELQAIP